MVQKSAPLIITENRSLILVHRDLTKLHYNESLIYIVSTLVSNEMLNKNSTFGFGFKNSTDMSVIGYIAQCCKNTVCQNFNWRVLLISFEGA